MNEIETFLSDFREMAESLKHFRVELIWCEPETGEFVYTYSWCVMLGTFNIEREDDRHIYRQLKDFDYWKLCLNVSIEALFDTGNSTDTPTFCEELKNSVQEMQRDTEKIEEWMKKHPEIPWYRIEDEEEGDEEDERD